MKDQTREVLVWFIQSVVAVAFTGWILFLAYQEVKKSGFDEGARAVHSGAFVVVELPDGRLEVCEVKNGK